MEMSVNFDPIEKLSFTPWTKSIHKQYVNFDCSFTWVDVPDYEPFSVIDDLGISILILGRLYNETKGCRLDKSFLDIATNYRKHGVQSLNRIDGAGSLLVIDHKSDEAVIVTDRMGFFPLYVACQEHPNGVRLCSHPDVLAASYASQFAFDEATMAEFIVTGRSVHPYTYYQNIRQLDAGSMYVWSQNGLKKHTTYFKPEPNLDYTSGMEKLAKKLAMALKDSIDMRIKETKGDIGLLLSGGLDSRIIAFSSPAQSRTTAITFCNDENYEVAIAKTIASKAGISHKLLKRAFDYYGNSAVDAVRISGGMWCWSNAHSAGFTKDIGEMNLSLLLSGCYCDYLFKGLALDTQSHNILPKLLPSVQKLSEFKYEWYGKFYENIYGKLLNVVHDRLESQYAGIDTNNLSSENRLRIEISRLSPMSRVITIAFRTIMWRTLPFDLVVADNRLIDIFTCIPPEYKLNNNLFHRVLKYISPQCSQIIDANTKTIPNKTKIVRVIEHINEKIKDKLGFTTTLDNGLGGSGSWINWMMYIKESEVIKTLWKQSGKNNKDFFIGLIGFDPFESPPEEWVDRSLLFSRILTLSLWLDNRIR